jgi:hypothetical protein
MAASTSGHSEDFVDQVSAQDFFGNLFGLHVIGTTFNGKPDPLYQGFPYIGRGSDQLIQMLDFATSDRQFNPIGFHSDGLTACLLETPGLLFLNVDSIHPGSEVDQRGFAVYFHIALKSLLISSALSSFEM